MIAYSRVQQNTKLATHHVVISWFLADWSQIATNASLFDHFHLRYVALVWPRVRILSFVRVYLCDDWTKSWFTMKQASLQTRRFYALRSETFAGMEAISEPKTSTAFAFDTDTAFMVAMVSIESTCETRLDIFATQILKYCQYLKLHFCWNPPWQPF